MTLDDFEAQFHRAVTEYREGRADIAVRRMLRAGEEYAASRAVQMLEATIRGTRPARERKAS